MKNERKLFTPGSILLFSGLLLLCAFAIFLLSLAPKGTAAIVEKNGETVFRQELSRLSGPKEIQVEGENGIALTVACYPDGAAVLSSQCPDQICVHTGKLTRAGETAICLPAKVSLRLEGGGNGTDGAAF